MIFDPMYMLMVALPGMLIAGVAQMMVQSAYAKYSQVPNEEGMTGAEAAALLLQRAGVHDVQIVPHEGYLTDHYDPMNKTLALSPPNFYGRSIAAVGIAAHEAGHALQHARNYLPLYFRSAIVPMASAGSGLGMILMCVGLAIAMKGLVLVGAILFSGVLLFQLVTLPVEFDATARAKRLLVSEGIISPYEREGVDSVLNAAALTYVAAAVSTLLTLLYFLFRSGLLGGGRSEE